MSYMTRDDVIRIVGEARERGVRPDLSDLDLYGLNLSNLDLSRVNLSGSNLSGTDMHGVDLRDVNLYATNLVDAMWDGLVIDGLYPDRIILTPTPAEWILTIGCWSGTPDELRVLIAQDDGWPAARGDEVTRRRPLLEAALTVCEAHITAHPGVITDLKGRWEV